MGETKRGGFITQLQPLAAASQLAPAFVPIQFPFRSKENMDHLSFLWDLRRENCYIASATANQDLFTA